MIETLLPAHVVTTATVADQGEHVLMDVERVRIAGAVEARRQEYATVRWAARTCLRILGYPPVALLAGEGGAPQWPSGVVGSMTHCVGYRAAAVSRTSHADGVGIDAEPDLPLPDGVLDMIASTGEQAALSEIAVAGPVVSWDRLLFSSKESFYKVWYPATGRWLGFDDVEAAFFGAHPLPRLAGTGYAGDFVVRPLPGGARRARRSAAAGAVFDAARTEFPPLRGRWATARGVLVTAIVAPVGSLPRTWTARALPETVPAGPARPPAASESGDC